MKLITKGNCCVCQEETELYCSSCCYTFGGLTPTYYCEKHYKTTVMTGNCCSESERFYKISNKKK